MTGIVTLSIELELGWGMHDQAEYGQLSSDRSAETEALHRLLDLAGPLNLPITFEIVGQLFHDSCSGYHPGPHPELWWDENPVTCNDSDPLFYGPDLVREIRNRKTDHELATHTNSHLLADEATSEELEYELATVDDLHADTGLPAPTSIVMLRHQDLSRNAVIFNICSMQLMKPKKRGAMYTFGPIFITSPMNSNGTR